MASAASVEPLFQIARLPKNRLRAPVSIAPDSILVAVDESGSTEGSIFGHEIKSVAGPLTGALFGHGSLSTGNRSLVLWASDARLIKANQRNVGPRWGGTYLSSICKNPDGATQPQDSARADHGWTD